MLKPGSLQEREPECGPGRGIPASSGAEGKSRTLPLGSQSLSWVHSGWKACDGVVVGGAGQGGASSVLCQKAELAGSVGVGSPLVRRLAS